MITSQINETTVWLDQLEDEGQDVFASRLLCTYNYFNCLLGNGPDVIMELDRFGYREEIGNGVGHGSGHGTKYGVGNLGDGDRRKYGDGYVFGFGDGDGYEN